VDCGAVGQLRAEYALISGFVIGFGMIFAFVYDSFDSFFHPPIIGCPIECVGEDEVEPGLQDVDGDIGDVVILVKNSERISPHLSVVLRVVDRIESKFVINEVGFVAPNEQAVDKPPLIEDFKFDFL
jgi:hypothetical protein